MAIDQLTRDFAAPPNSHRMLPLFRIDDEVDPRELQWQLDSLKAQGFGGIFSICERFHNGCPEPFVSDWWRNVVKELAAACAQAGLEFWVYDDEDWPSGSIGGQLPERNPDAQWKYLAHETHVVAAGEHVTLKPGEGKLVAAVASRKTVRSIDPESSIELTSEIKDGALTWQAPAGDAAWLVEFFIARKGVGIFIDGYGDLMDRESMGQFVDWVYEWHRKAVAEVPGANLKGYFTDEPAFSYAMSEWQDRFHWYPSMPYSPEIGKYFKELHGYAMEPHMPLLYHDVDPVSIRFRCHYWATCCHMYSTNYFKQIYDYCEQHGVKSSGHLVVEESFHNHLCQQAGNLPTHFRHMHIPGIDWIHPFESFEHLPATTPKYATSMAHLMGRPRVWCESFAAAGWGVTFQQMRRILNWEHVNGINMQIPITYVYSLRKRVEFYPPGISYQQPWWDHARGLADYEARLCVLAAGTGHKAQIALAYPSVDMWANCWNHKLLIERGNAFNNLGDALRRAGYDFDILDDQALVEQSRVDNGLLRTEHEAFSVLIIPRSDAVKRAMIECARDFAKSGGLVIFTGLLPKHSYEHGSHDPELAAILTEMLGKQPYCCDHGHTVHACGKGTVIYAQPEHETMALLRERVTPDLIVEGGEREVYAWHRALGDDSELYFVFNMSDTARRVKVSLGTAGHPEHWNPENGAIEPMTGYTIAGGRTALELDFAPQQLIPVVLRPKAGAAPRQFRHVQSFALEGEWDFKLDATLQRPNIGWNFPQREHGWQFAPEAQPPARVPAGDWQKLGLPYFSGIGIYSRTVTLPAIPAGGRIELHLGEVALTAEVKVNGASAGLVCFAPWKIELSSFLNAGENRLDVAVANSLSNYFAQFKELEGKALNQGGDLPERRVSGLLGPVTLEIYAPA